MSSENDDDVPTVVIVILILTQPLPKIFLGFKIKKARFPTNHSGGSTA